MSKEKRNKLNLCSECRGTSVVFFQNADGAYDCDPCMTCLEDEVKQIEEKAQYSIDMGWDT